MILSFCHRFSSGGGGFSPAPLAGLTGYPCQGSGSFEGFGNLQSISEFSPRGWEGSPTDQRCPFVSLQSLSSALSKCKTSSTNGIAHCANSRGPFRCLDRLIYAFAASDAGLKIFIPLVQSCMNSLASTCWRSPEYILQIQDCRDCITERRRRVP